MDRDERNPLARWRGWRRWGAIALAAACVAVLAVAFGPGLVASAGQQASSTPTTVAGAPAGRVDPLVAGILADGTVDASEMTAALEAAVGCMQAQGLGASYTINPDGNVGISVELGRETGDAAADTARFDARSAAANACQATFVRPLMAAYAPAGLTQAEKVEAAASIGRCMADEGVGGTAGVSLEDLRSLDRLWYAVCASKVGL